MLASIPKVPKRPEALKIDVFDYPTVDKDAPLQRTAANIRTNLMLPETRVNSLHFCRR